MKRPAVDVTWPDEWRRSYAVDLQEVFGEVTDVAYAHAYALRREEALAAVRRHIPAGSRVLDVAGAQGNFSLTLAEAGYCVTWNDLRSELKGYVALKHETGSLDFLPGNVHDLVVSEPFDGALMTEVIEHVAHPDRFLAAVAGLVRPGGHIVMTTPNGEYWRHKHPRFSDCPDPSMYEALQFRPDADGHIFLLHEDEVVKLADGADLDVVEQRYFTNTLSAGHVKLARVLKALPEAAVATLERATATAQPSFLGRKLNAQMLWVLKRRVA